MPTFRIESRSIGGAINEAAKKLDDLTPVLEAIGKLMVESVEEEFEREEWKRPTGGTYKWPKSKAFPKKPAPTKTLQRSGKMLQGWKNFRTTKRTVRLENTTKSDDGFPYPIVHRRVDAVGRVNLNPTIIKADPNNRGKQGRLNMFWALFAELGITLSEDKLLNVGISIPARPHATNNPELARNAIEAISRFLPGGSAA